MRRALVLFVLSLTLGACAPKSNSAVSPVSSTPPEAFAPLLSRVNEVRRSGYDCGPRGSFGPAGAVRWNDHLALAASRHSLDMAEHGLFSHTGSDGSSVSGRVERAGYAWSVVGETLAYGGSGHFDARSVVDAWLGSPGHCATLLEPDFTELGAAVARGELDYWTVDLGAPQVVQR